MTKKGNNQIDQFTSERSNLPGDKPDEVRDYIKTELANHFISLQTTAKKKGLTSEKVGLLIKEILFNELFNIVSGDFSLYNRQVKLVPTDQTDLTKEQQLSAQNISFLNATLHAKSISDQKFIENVLGVIERNISNPNLDTEQFMKETGMSRTQLYKKIKAVTKQSLFEFIYVTRLSKAAQMLLHENISITEVAARVGYYNLSVFTRSFKRQFNIIPSKYAQSIYKQHDNL